MEREKAERFVSEAKRLAEAFVGGMDAILDELSDDEVQHLTELLAELRAEKPGDAVIQIIAEAANDEYGRRFNTKAAPTDSETWIEF